MKINNENIILNNKLNLEILLNAQRTPEIFSEGEELFWDDPHISKAMLKAHLDPEWDSASRDHKTIDETVNWLSSYLNLKEGAKVLDLGCGPGLYCTRFFHHGYKVVGMDYSRNSIDYAVKYAEDNSMDIQYIYQNYLTMDYSCEFDAIFLINCDFGALTDTNRDILLKRIKKALKVGGVFVFDAFTSLYRKQQSSHSWYVSDCGFWRPYRHLVLDQTFHYEEENIYLNQHTVIDNDGKVTVYKMWNRCYEREDILQLMSMHGYQVQDVCGDLTGGPYEKNVHRLGIIAKNNG